MVMRILFLGAGGTGGYFGGRAAQAGADITFLVRDARAERLRADGLVIKSGAGDAVVKPRLVTAATLESGYDAVVLSCKAYDLDSALDAIAPAVGPDTVVLPIMNGVLHYEVLDSRFGAHRVLGGLCNIVATLNPAGQVVHSGRTASLTLGERSGEPNSARALALAAELRKSDLFTTKLSSDIYQDIWEKFVFLATLAASTCLFRGPVGTISSTDDGEEIMRAMLAECQSVAAASSHPVRADAHDTALTWITDKQSRVTASMYRDLAGGGPVEADAIVGDMVHRAKTVGLETPYLRAAYCHLQVYQQLRQAAS
jgi:2-dehydropantoate 2-reductase